jgi:hypothetical protein
MIAESTSTLSTSALPGGSTCILDHEGEIEIYAIHLGIDVSKRIACSAGA